MNIKMEHTTMTCAKFLAAAKAGEIPMDTPVMVRNSEDDDWERMYFAEYFEMYLPYNLLAWSNGATSWSKGGYQSWEFMRLPTEKELV